MLLSTGADTIYVSVCLLLATRLCWVRYTSSMFLFNTADCVDSLLFMSATDEELEYVKSLEMDHVTYVLIMFR
jgi:hypothetical protein